MPAHWTGRLSFWGAVMSTLISPRNVWRPRRVSCSACGGDVTQRLYPNLAHTINQDEIDYVRNMMRLLLTAG